MVDRESTDRRSVLRQMRGLSRLQVYWVATTTIALGVLVLWFGEGILHFLGLATALAQSISREIGAILIATGLLGVYFEFRLRRSFLADVELTLTQVINERYTILDQCIAAGVASIHESLSEVRLHARFRNAKKSIRIMQTWTGNLAALGESILQAAKENECEVKILLLDPCSIQAPFRSEGLWRTIDSTTRDITNDLLTFKGLYCAHDNNKLFDKAAAARVASARVAAANVAAAKAAAAKDAAEKADTEKDVAEKAAAAKAAAFAAAAAQATAQTDAAEKAAAEKDAAEKAAAAKDAATEAIVAKAAAAEAAATKAAAEKDASEKDASAKDAAAKDAAVKGSIEVRLYNTIPAFSLYGHDDTNFIGIYWRGRMGVSSPQFEIVGSSITEKEGFLRQKLSKAFRKDGQSEEAKEPYLAKAVDEHFTKLWNISQPWDPHEWKPPHWDEANKSPCEGWMPIRETVFPELE